VQTDHRHGQSGVLGVYFSVRVVVLRLVLFAAAVGSSACASGWMRRSQGVGAFLDVTHAVVRVEPGHSLEAGTSSWPPAPHRPFPLRVELVRIEPRLYRTMEVIVYDVRLENVSTTPVVIPWSPVPIMRRDRPSAGYRHAMIALSLSAGEQHGVYADAFVLYGAPTVPHSLKCLMPGERATIRLPATIARMQRLDVTDETPRMPIEISARAEVSVYAPNDPAFALTEHETSFNTRPLSFLPTTPAVIVQPHHWSSPHITAVSTRAISPDCEIRLEGYRMQADDRIPTFAHLSKGDIRVKADVAGGEIDVSNEPDGSPQALEVHLPPDVTPGDWHLVVERAGQSSAPIAITIGAVGSPRIAELSPRSLNPGGEFWVFGSHFRRSDRLDVIDANGRAHDDLLFHLSCEELAGEIPQDFPAGLATVRIRAQDHDDDEANANANNATGDVASATVMVTMAPLPLEMYTLDMTPVAPGQWTELAVMLNGALERSERTDVEFAQAGHAEIVRTWQPHSRRVRVPSFLHDGPVILRTRTWRDGLASVWSEPGRYDVVAHPIAPVIRWMAVGPERQQVNLAPGPLRPDHINAIAGDDLRLFGMFPVATPWRMHLILEGPTGVGRCGRPAALTMCTSDFHPIWAKASGGS
jgi:hypothetical protein